LAGDPGADAVTDDDTTLEVVTEEMEADLAAVEDIARERDEYLALAQRLQADFENLKKQSQHRIAVEVERATGRMVENLLTVLDAFDNAMIHGVEGVAPIYKAMIDVLQKEGLEVVPAEGVAFDPNHHEAVLHEPAGPDDDEPTVAETLRTGYTWKGKTLRPAMVKVRG
jgi:molecular chaperone GrpE